MDTTIKQAFAGGLLIGIAANLLADGLGGQVREQGYTSRHVAMLGVLFFGAFLLLWSAEQAG